MTPSPALEKQPIAAAAPDALATPGQRRRVLHFVTGGFSGATQVAADLCRAEVDGEAMEVLLVLRRKRNTDAARVQALRDQGLRVEVLPGGLRLATVWALWRLCRRWRPQVLVAHGFPEHLLGRLAGWLAGVPALVQIEHNTRERYGPLSLALARWLARRSAALVGVSEGVRRRLLGLGMPQDLTLAIPNGIELARFDAAQRQPWGAREPGIVMSARFARQKDQPTLIRALALLGQRGMSPALHLAGAGQARRLRAARAEAARLGLADQVRFLGHHPRMPELLMGQQIFVLATHWEGMPLALVEAMAAGCACVASAVPGVEGVLEQEVTGLLVPESDPAALADALERLLREPGLAERLGAAARAHALEAHGLALMRQRYRELLLRI